MKDRPYVCRARYIQLDGSHSDPTWGILYFGVFYGFDNWRKAWEGACQLMWPKMLTERIQ